RRGAPGRRLADDRGDRRLTTTAMPLTPSRPSSFELASDEVHSWCASLDVPPETSARLYATLTPDERTRSARFRFERDQQRFIVARGVLRELLGRSEERRVGKECRSRWSGDQRKKNNNRGGGRVRYSH